METLEERKCLHDSGGQMSSYEAIVRITATFTVKVSGEFNPNYKTAVDTAEDHATDKAWDLCPKGYVDPEFEAECIDISIKKESQDADHDR